MSFRPAALLLASLVVAAGLGASLAAVVAGSPHPAVGKSKSTTVVSYDPFSATGSLATDLRVRQRFQGRCSGGGVAGGTTYRCLTTTSQIIDPCFAVHSRGPFFCPTDPLVPAVDEITVHTAADVTPIEPSRMVWAVELMDGQICTRVNAAWGGLGPFSCRHSVKSAPREVADCRVPVRAVPWWSVSCQHSMNGVSPFRGYEAKMVWH